MYLKEPLGYQPAIEKVVTWSGHKQKNWQVGSKVLIEILSTDELVRLTLSQIFLFETSDRWETIRRKIYPDPSQHHKLSKSQKNVWGVVATAWQKREILESFLVFSFRIEQGQLKQILKVVDKNSMESIEL